jgi:hypothetical protein
MAFKHFVRMVYPANFQLNRVFTHGNEACREAEPRDIAHPLAELSSVNWCKEGRGLATWAEGEGRLDPHC